MATQLTLNDGSLNSAGALAIKTNGTTQAINITTGQQVEFNDGSGSAPSITNTGDNNTGLFFPAADTVGITTGGTERARVDSSGNLGLGVTPSAWSTGKAIQIGTLQAGIWGAGDQIDICGNAYYNAGWKAAATKAGATLYEMALGTHAWSVSGAVTAGNPITFTQAMTLDASGYLMVGTTTSNSAKLTLSNAGAESIQFYPATSSNDNQTLHYNRSTSTYCNNSTYAAAHLFYIQGNEKARIDSSGNLLVGQTSVSQTANGVAIQYSGDATNLSRISVGGTGAGTGYSLYSGTASAYRFYVSYAGQIYATSTSITAISDQTLKTNVRDLETGLTEVMALKPRRFDWINGDATNVAGFIAQEVAEVFPELVDDYVYNIDEEGNTITKKSLKMGDILPTLVKAMQEQQAIITALTARITALEQA